MGFHFALEDLRNENHAEHSGSGCGGGHDARSDHCKPVSEEKLESYKEVYKQVVGFEANLPDLPILYNVNVGHAYPIGVFPLGLQYEIDCDNKTLTLVESATV